MRIFLEIYNIQLIKFKQKDFLGRNIRLFFRGKVQFTFKASNLRPDQAMNLIKYYLIKVNNYTTSNFEIKKS